MANFSESNLQKGMVNVTKALMHKGEFRMPDTAVISSAINAIAVNPLTGALRTREDRSVSTYMPVKAAASTATERTHNGSFARNTSIETAVAWNSHVSGFSISDKQLDNNSFSYEDAFQTGFLGAAQDVMAKAETKFIASLVAAKSQVNAGGINGTFIPATHTMDIALAQKDLFFHNLHTNLKVNKYRGTPTVIVDSLASITAGHQANQGTGNSTNLGYQYMGMNIVTTTNALITGGAANIGTAVAFEQGLVGVDFWIPKQNRGALDAVQALTTNGAVGHVNVAFYDEFGNVKYTVPFAIFVRRVAADTSGANGSKQDWITTVEVSVDSSFATAPISGTNDESAIFAYKQLNA